MPRQHTGTHRAGAGPFTREGLAAGISVRDGFHRNRAAADPGAAVAGMARYVGMRIRRRRLSRAHGSRCARDDARARLSLVVARRAYAITIRAADASVSITPKAMKIFPISEALPHAESSPDETAAGWEICARATVVDAGGGAVVAAWVAASRSISFNWSDVATSTPLVAVPVVAALSASVRVEESAAAAAAASGCS